MEPFDAYAIPKVPLFSKPRTKAMREFLEREKDRVVGLSIEDAEYEGEKASVWIYTDSSKWDDGNCAGSFRAGSETAAIAYFYANVQQVPEGGRR